MYSTYICGSFIFVSLNVFPRCCLQSWDADGRPFQHRDIHADPRHRDLQRHHEHAEQWTRNLKKGKAWTKSFITPEDH